MKKRLLDIIVCPIDRSPLELIEWENRELELKEHDLMRIKEMNIDPNLFSREIISGVLLNNRRKIFYPIINAIPRLIVFPNPLTQDFVRKNSERLSSDCSGFSLPNEKGAPGETDVLRSFSKEWTDYQWDGESYWNLTPEKMFEYMSRTLNLKNKNLNGKLVLEVGIGIGGIADNISKTESCELVGMDLGYAVDAAYTHFGENNTFIHIIQGSAFAPPVRFNCFDFVYSQGVIHHTYSTRDAFNNLAKLPKIGAYLYIWVYSHYDEERTFARRLLMLMEKIIRPICWRMPTFIQTFMLLPILPLYIIYQNYFRAIQNKDREIKYSWSDALHAARDRFTPRFIWRHSNEEVEAWFQEMGYCHINNITSREDLKDIPIAFTACTGVEGKREN